MQLVQIFKDPLLVIFTSSHGADPCRLHQEDTYPGSGLAET